MAHRLWVTLVAVLLAFSSGCGPRTTPGGSLLATGKLTHQGKPLNAVNISLVVPGETTIRAAGVTSPDGAFELRPPEGGGGILPAGAYIVLLEAIGGEGWSFSAKLQDPTSSPLRIDFRPGEPLFIEAPPNTITPIGGRSS